jgi:predicted DNA-binding protein with PD1-like motif
MDAKKIDQGWLVRIDRGEEIVETLTRFLEEKTVSSGFLGGIGAVVDPELGLYTMKTREYLRRRFEGEYEIAALTGNVSLLEGKPFAHLHALLSDADCSVIGGHLFEAKVGVTCEITLTVFAEALHRRRDESTGLNLLDFSQ